MSAGRRPFPLRWLPLALFAGAGCGGRVEVDFGDPGAEAYATYCALCHGDTGQGYAADAATALSNAELLSTATNAFLEYAIVRGRPGTSMSAWGDTFGGPLGPEEIDAVIDFIRRWQTAPSVDVGDEPVEGVAGRGAPLYEFKCAKCHGPAGEGVPYVSLANPSFLASASDGFLRHAIAKGRLPTPMEAYETSLTEQGIHDLVALIRTWQTPEEEMPSEWPSADLGDVVINPDGPEPELGADLYVAVDSVKAEIDRGAALVLLDARPPVDYVRGHIPGAVSVPFYAVERYLDQLPTDHWIVAYCACPHAESGEAAAVLEANGYTRVRVLDEGVGVWEARGYPIVEGPEPW